MNNDANSSINDVILELRAKVALLEHIVAVLGRRGLFNDIVAEAVTGRIK